MKRALLCLISLFSVSALAGDLEWSGLYRFEGYHIKNSELNAEKREKSYGLHHLILRPKIVAADGLTIYSQFNIFNYDTADKTYANSQMGQLWGSGVGGTGETNTVGNSNSMSQNQKAETLEVTQLYLTLNQEFGQLLVGRAPIQFGLGMTHNAGMGLFDHWYDTRDLVAYKIVMGNFWVMPMMGKSDEGAINQSDDVSDLMLQVQFERPSTGLEMGVFYMARRAGDQGNDHPVNGDVIGGPGATVIGRQSTSSVNLYALKNTDRIRLGLEASFLDGDTGVFTQNGENVGLSGFGLAGEFEYRPEGSPWKFGAKAGLATGDNPDTPAKYEGFAFDRNYDVAFLMFNHPLGQRDFLRTGLYGGGPDLDTTNSIDRADTESLSNVMYLSPYTFYQLNDQWKFDSSLTFGWLQENPMVGQADKSLGYELDFAVHFTPKKGVTWINQVGLLFPGGAFEGDGTLESKFSYGLATKAAISF